MEYALEGALDAGLAYRGVHGIALAFVYLIVLGAHQADVAEDMRRVLGMVDARAAHRDVDPGEIVFAYHAYKVDARVV